MQHSVFENLGYHKDFWVNNKYVGHIKMTNPDRKDCGYFGRITEVLTSSIVLDNNKTLPAGVQVTHECIPLCGSIIGKTLQDRIEIIKEHYIKTPYKQNKQ